MDKLPAWDMDMEHWPGDLPLGEIADFLEGSGDALDAAWLARLVERCFGADALRLLRLDLVNEQAWLLAGDEGRRTPQHVVLTNTDLMAALARRDFYTPLCADAFPELCLRHALPHCLLVPLGVGEAPRGLLVLAYAAAPPPLEEARYHGLRILAADLGRRLQRGDDLCRLKMADKSTHRLLAKVKGLLQRTPIMINGFDAKGRCVLWNRECERVFGWTFEELQRHPQPLVLLYPDVAQRQAVAGTFSVSGGGKFREWSPMTRTGERLVTLWANIMMPNGDILGIGHDITEQRQADRRLRLAASVFESSYDGIMITDARNRISDVNPAFTRMTGYAKHEIVGLDPCVLGSDRHDADFFCALWKSLADQDSWQGEVWNRRKSGEVHPQLLSISVVRDQQHNILHHVAVFTDITHLKQRAAELEHLARFDALTNVPNRRLFSEHLHKALLDTRRQPATLAVCYLDLDGFKPVNDSLGHAAGDQLLVVVSERLRHVIRPCDTLARLGGDEFAVLLTGLHDDQEYAAIVQRMLRIISEPITLGNTVIRISASVGVTLFPRDDVTADRLLQHADHAMYQAKKYGKNQYHLFAQGEDRADITHQRIERLEQALLTDELCLYYQPKVDLRSGEVVGFEALLRWHHPELGVLSPAAFLPAMMGSPLEFRLGEWVVERVLEQLQRWQQQGRSLTISFNISANHLMRPEFVDFLGEALARYPEVSRDCLELEFQESVALEDVEAARSVLQRCREKGVRIALDDFGTGYSSLLYLKKLPIDILKIDRSFVHDILEERSGRGLIASIMQLASTLELMVIAEGVESEAQGLLLIELGCFLVQGYSIAEPMPPEGVLPWLIGRSAVERCPT